MNQFEIIGGMIVRHGLTTFAGVLATHGYLGTNTREQFVSAVMLLMGIGLSWWQKTGHAAVVTRLAELRARVRSIPPVHAGVPVAVLTEASMAITAAKQI